MSALDETIAEIRAHHRQRIYAMEQRKRADLSLGAFLRVVLGWSLALPEAEREAIRKQAAEMISIGEAITKGKPVETNIAFETYRRPILLSIMARAPFDEFETEETKAMEKLAMTLPAWAWAEGVRGLSARGLAVIVGEAGDIGNYATVSKLWKRCGLAVMDGVRQGGLPKNASKETWIAHGYNRQRRSRLWVIGDVLMKTNGDGPYRAVYDLRREYTAVTHPDWTKMHSHLDAQRVMTKRLLRDLWRAWRETSTHQATDAPLSPAAESRDAA